MNIFAFSGLSTTVSCTVLAPALLFFGKTKLHRSLMTFNIVVAFWGFGLFLTGIARNETAALFGWKFAHAGGFFVAPSFY